MKIYFISNDGAEVFTTIEATIGAGYSFNDITPVIPVGDVLQNLDKPLGMLIAAALDDASDYDPTPYCSGCNAMFMSGCNCGPRAAND